MRRVRALRLTQLAGYPEGHCDATTPDIERDIGFLRAKQDAGADFVVTQLFYCVDAFLDYLKRCRAAGAFRSVYSR